MPEQKQTLAEVLPSAKKTVNKSTERKAPADNKTLLHFIRLVIVVSIILVFGLIFTAWGNYSEGWQNYFVDSVNKVVPFPAASVGAGNWITIDEYNKNVKAMRLFLENKEAAYGGGNYDFSTPNGLKRLAIIKKNVLNQLIDNRLTETIAGQQGISISESELNDTASKIISRDGKRNENVAQLSALYGWTTDDFRDKVVKNLLYQQKLEDKIKNNGELDTETKKKIAEIKNKLASGEKFSDIAKKYSDSSSKQYGGLLPAFSREDAPQVFADAAFKLTVGQVGNLIESDDGWHLIKLEKKFTESGKEKVEVSHILIQRKTLKEWLSEKKKTYGLKIYLKPYYWNEQMSKLYFKDESLNLFEQDSDRVNLNEKMQEADFLLNNPNNINKDK